MVYYHFINIKKYQEFTKTRKNSHLVKRSQMITNMSAAMAPPSYLFILTLFPGRPPTCKTWKSQGIWQWSGKSQGKCVCLWCVTAIAMVTE